MKSYFFFSSPLRNILENVPGTQEDNTGSVIFPMRGNETDVRRNMSTITNF